MPGTKSASDVALPPSWPTNFKPGVLPIIGLTGDVAIAVIDVDILVHRSIAGVGPALVNDPTKTIQTRYHFPFRSLPHSGHRPLLALRS
jgi:hypothetical protein